MDRLIFEGSNDKPAIHLDKEMGIISISGSSLPENVLDVYSPVLLWLEEYIANPNPSTKAEFFFEYLNTASSHMIMRIFRKITELKDRCDKLNIHWYYPTGDLDMRHFGEELAEITNLRIHILSRELNS